MNKTEEYLLIGGIVIFVVLLYLFMPGLSDEHEIQYSAQRTVTERPFFLLTERERTVTILLTYVRNGG